jgi:hypothetical protein
MNKLYTMKTKTAFIIFIFLDIICVGMGMGVPIFCILFGFVVGWYNVKRVDISQSQPILALRKLMLYAANTSAITFILMAVLWGHWALILFNSNTDYSNLGIPMILFDPKVSFIGWLILMIFISPFLQMLTTIFVSILTLVITKHSKN